MRIEDPFIGRQLANFRIERLLGRGGMAAVYFGWDVKLERPVAIKVIDANYRSDRSYAERFVREARAVATWQHPNILQVYYADDEDGIYYYVMEFVHGLDLGQLLNQYAEAGELMPLEDVLRIGRATASALDYAHRKGVIHRDVKPSNIMIAEDGRVVLADFGLAMNVTEGSLGQVFGSPQYIAPEQARNSAGAVLQSDLYSLGVMLYEMLTGALPFDDPSPTALALQHVTQEPPPPCQVNPNLSQAVEDVLLKALNKNPQERYPSGESLMDALEEAVQTLEPTAPFLTDTPTAPVTTGAPRRRVSHASLSKKISEYIDSHPLPPLSGSEPLEPPPVAKKKTRPAPLFIWSVGCGALVLVAGLVFVLGSALAFSRTATATPTQVLAALITTQKASPTPSGTPTPSPSATPTATHVPATSTPTATNTPPPTATATQPPAPTATSEPTVVVQQKPADGDLFELYYNDASLYFKNLSGKDRSIYPVAFERIDKNGTRSNRFDGWRWGNIYSKFRADYCMELEVINRTDHLDPKECHNRQLVIRTPTSDQPYIFWTKDSDSREFAVLWRNEEVGRCKIAKGSCKVYLPKEK